MNYLKKASWALNYLVSVRNKDSNKCGNLFI